MSITKVKPKKALGQHFLTDMSVARRIADTVADTTLPILEIGPGMGVLTQFLLEAHPDRVNVVEIDTESVDYLKRNMPELDGRIIEGDFLQLDPADIFGGQQFCVIGNYPYNISSQIFFKILEYKDRVPLCAGMLQREVAERLAAPEGSKTRGILSVLLQAWYDVEYLFTVSEHVFNPPPKVKSGVIRLKRNRTERLDCDERLFRNIVKLTFGQRRKTIRNSIRSLLNASVPLPDHPLLAMRPEQLTVDQFVELTQLVNTLRSRISTP